MKRAVAAASNTYLRRPAEIDGAEFVARVAESTHLHGPFVQPPADLPSFRGWLTRGRRPDIEQYLVCSRADDTIVGFVNLNNIITGNLQQAFIGYAVMAGSERRGHSTQGVEMVLRMAFTVLRLHRIEANIQPGNVASRALAVRTGFRLEGYSPSYLRVGGEWRDHERWAQLASDWRRRIGDPGGTSESLTPAPIRDDGHPTDAPTAVRLSEADR